MLHNSKKRATRRGWPIHGYVGSNGGGKSTAMAWDTIPSLLAGRPVLSTVRLLDFQNPRPCPGCDELGHVRPVMVPAEGPSRPYEPPPMVQVGETIHQAAHPLWIPFTEWSQLLEAKACDVLMDEVTGVASSRESQSMPAPVANKLVQLRRADVIVRWSAPNWARADKIIRECSQVVTYARGYLPKPDGDADRMWRNRRLFKWTTYDASEFENFTVGKREQLKPLQRDWHWGPSSIAFRVFDTFDAVLSIGTVTDSGRCYQCGGTRRAPACSCPDYKHGKRSADAGSPAGGAVAEPHRHLALTDHTG